MKNRLLNQELDLAYKSIKGSLQNYQKEDSQNQEKNRLVLKNIFLSIISLVKFILLKVGFILKCKIKPTDSISKKVEEINSYNKKLLKDDMEFLNKIIKWRNKLEHNDLEFPSLDLINKTLKEFDIFLQNIKSNIYNFFDLKEDTQKRLQRSRNKIQSLKEFISKEHFSSLVRETDLINTLLSTNFENITKIREKLSRLVEALINIFPFSKKFTELICNNNLIPSKDPFSTIENFWLKISNNQECPICGSQELRSNFWICKEYPSFKKIFNALVPFEAIEKPTNAFCSNETWDNGMYCDCGHFEDCNRLLENNNLPIGSKFCDDCGFYFLPLIETGLVEDFTAYWLHYLETWD